MKIIQRKLLFMKRKNSAFRMVFAAGLSLWFMLSTVFSGASLASAEVRCESDVSYVWRKPPVATTKEVSKMAMVQEPEPQKYLFSKPSVVSSSEAEARAKLQDLVLREKAEAQSACQKEHENVSHCIGTKLESMSSVLDRVSFKAREQLQLSIQADCELKRGICQATESSEVTCTAQAEEEKADDSKKEVDAKAKKKK